MIISSSLFNYIYMRRGSNTGLPFHINREYWNLLYSSEDQNLTVRNIDEPYLMMRKLI